MSYLTSGLSGGICESSAKLAGYTRVREKYYKYSGYSETYAVARDNCSADGGRLVQFDGGISEYHNVFRLFAGII